jgi:thioredoxin 1
MQVLKFQAQWCSPCKLLDAQLKRLFPLLEVTKVDTDEERQLAQQYNIRSIPTLIILDENGKEIKRLTGSVTDIKLKEFFV